MSVITKLMFTFDVCLLSVVLQNPLINGGLVLVVGAIIPIARIRWVSIRPFASAALPLAAVFVVLWSFFTPGDNAIASWPVPGISFEVSLTQQGLTLGFVAAFRLLAIVFSTALLLISTNERDLVRGLQAFGSPYVVAFTFLLAIRLVGMLLGDLNTILEARKARGLSNRAGPLSVPSQAASLVIPLMMVSFRRIQTVTNALETRAFSAGGKRTARAKPSFTTLQKLILFVSIATIAIAIYFRIFGASLFL